MAITKIIPRWQGRGATTNEDGVRTLKRQWIVETSADPDGEPAVIDAVIAAFPSAALYASHPQWPKALCRNLTADPHTSARNWVVSATYSTARFESRGDGSGSSAANSASPNAATASTDTPADQRAPTITVGRREVAVPLEYDLLGDRVTNTVGDPFDPPPEVARSRLVYTWKFWRTPAQLNWATRSLWIDCINEDTVPILGRNHAPGTLRVTDYALGTVWDTGPAGLAFFFELTCQVEFEPEGWAVRILNTGRRRREGAGSTLDPFRAVNVVDPVGQPIGDPVPLTAAGVPVIPGGAYHYVQPLAYAPFPFLGTGGSLTGAGGLLA